MARSFIVYRGPSHLPRLPGEPVARIVATLTRSSRNAKTGRMAQLHILPERSNPAAAQRTGADASVCGDCPLRPALGGGCYVSTGRAPLASWKAAKGRPAELAPALAYLRASGLPIRLGAYGDPAALPLAVVRALAEAANHRLTGYTHAWRNPRMAPWARYLMASCETETDVDRAHALGWRTFRATLTGASSRSDEIVCPNETRGTSCADCLLCRGTILPLARSITISVHGFARRKAADTIATLVYTPR